MAISFRKKNLDTLLSGAGKINEARTKAIAASGGYRGATYRGLQRTGYKPAGIGGGGFSQNIYDPDFDFNKYDINYNPWGEGADAEAMKEAFETRLMENSEEAMKEFARLKRDAFGYSYTTVPGAASSVSVAPSAQEQRHGSARDTGVWGTKDDIVYGRGEGYDSTASKDKYGRTVLRAGKASPFGRGDSWGGQKEHTVHVRGKELSAIDEYKLWRYDVMTTQTKEAVGTGPNDLYTGLDYMGLTIDKSLAPQAGVGQAGPQTAGGVDRAARQQGQSLFARRDIFSKRRSIREEREKSRGKGANVGNPNQATGIQLGG